MFSTDGFPLVLFLSVGLYNSLLKIASKLESDSPLRTKMIIREMVNNGIGKAFNICNFSSYLSVLLSRSFKHFLVLFFTLPPAFIRRLV